MDGCDIIYCIFIACLLFSILTQSLFFPCVGVFLRKLESGLRGISHVIIDEIHERDINVSMFGVLVFVSWNNLVDTIRLVARLFQQV
jgi:hypothetical protein